MMKLNLFHSYKRVIHFLSGDNEGLPLENRIFNSSSLLVAILLFLATIINIAIAINLALIISTGVAAIIFSLFYYFSRFKNKFNKLVLPFTFFIYGMTILTWFLNAGTKGPITFAFLFILIIVISISQKRYHATYIISVVSILIGLLIIEYNKPELIIDYVHDETRFYDISYTLIIFIVLSSFIVQALKRNYEFERNKAEKKSMELLSSLEYASHIQEALLDNQLNIIDNFKDAFIIYLPRDIVSGDFYWYKKIGKLKFIAAADCTGHGVPGAMMSMLGASYLNEIVSDMTKYKANEMLNNLRKKIKTSLHQNETSRSKDGIDISLCILDEENMHMEFAGAMHSIYVYRKDELIKIKGDKMPIGISYNEIPFTNNTIKLESNDAIYLFTDGIVDQFGGEYGEKFKAKAFQKLLGKLQHLPMQKQKLAILSSYEQWKGKSFHQIDDILVIGIKI